MKITMERHRSRQWLIDAALKWSALVILGSAFGVVVGIWATA